MHKLPMRSILSSALVVSAALGPPAVAAAKPVHSCAFGRLFVGTLAEITRGDTFTLSGLDTQFVPADIVLGEIGGAMDGEAIRSSGELSAYSGDQLPDRYGRQPVHLYQQGHWLQGKLLRKGDALALPVTRSKPCRKALLDAESKNTPRRGDYWRSRGVELDATDLEGLAEKVGYFVMVTGIVRSVGDRTKRVYLNFGENWAHDFTVSIAKRGVGRFTGDQNRLIALTGKKVQIRGVLEENKGPLIRVIDDDQIQIIK